MEAKLKKFAEIMDADEVDRFHAPKLTILFNFVPKGIALWKSNIFGDRPGAKGSAQRHSPFWEGVKHYQAVQALMQVCRPY